MEPDVDSEYLLITEGREGTTENARAFFRELDRDIIPADPLNAIDARDRRQYFPKGPLITRRQLFEQITRRLCGVRDGQEPSIGEYRRVWTLLSRFDVQQKKFDEIEQEVLRILLGYVDAAEDVRGKARELYGLLLQLASEGNQTFTLHDLLRRAGLPTMSLAKLPGLRQAAAERLERQLKRLGHDALKTVRRRMAMTDQDEIFCVAGGSGFGKTTLAAQFAIDSATTDVVAFVSTRVGIADALQRAADEVWKRVLGHDKSIDWESLVRRAKQIGFADQKLWLTLFLDITAGAGEIDELLRLEWAEWNVRLVFTADESASRKTLGDAELAVRCGVQVLSELSVEERYELLKKRGRSMAHIPSDVLALLARPILADVYCRIARDAQWKPTNEYQLFNAFWNDAQSGHDGKRHPQNLSVLLRLADRLLDGRELYPWPQDALHEASINEDVLQRLIEHGWLRELETGDIEFAHERFANWAVARAISERVRRHSWTAADLSLHLGEIYDAGRSAGKPYYGYVPMDALWLVGQHEGTADLIADTIHSIQHRDWEGLSSLGPSIVPA